MESQFSPISAQVDCLGDADEDINREGRSTPQLSLHPLINWSFQIPRADRCRLSGSLSQRQALRAGVL